MRSTFEKYSRINVPYKYRKIVNDLVKKQRYCDNETTQKEMSSRYEQRKKF